MSRAHDIARFYGQGKEEKNVDGWLTFCCCHHNTKTPAMAVKDDDKGGVIVNCHGCDSTFKEIKDQFRKDGLLPEWVPPEKGTIKKKPATTAPKPAAAEKISFIFQQADRDHQENIKKYFAGRAIHLDKLPDCFKWNSYKDKATGEVQNMIVAAASKPTDKKVYAVQRLFIDLDDHTKTGAKMHGPCLGRGVYFDRKGPMRELIIGEGIETVLAGIQATGMNGVALLSTAGMKAWEPPEETGIIYILVDSDPAREKAKASMPGQKAARILAERFEASRPGRQAYLVSPDDSCFTGDPTKLDINDLLKVDPTGATIRTRFEKAVKFCDLEWSPPGQDEAENDDGSKGYYPQDTLDALVKMNMGFSAVVLSGNFRVAMEAYDDEAKTKTMYFMKKTAFFDYFANKKVWVRAGSDGESKLKPIALVWHEWDGRPTYDKVAFDPSGNASPSTYNLFRGFRHTPKQGNWSLMREHIFQVICDGNSEHFDYVLAWMARGVQDPGGDKPGVALVLKGGKGIGKGVFANYYGEIFGDAFLPIADAGGFTGRFNMHLSKSLLVFLDEAVWGGDKQAEGKLKQLITEPTIMFEPKGIDSMAMRNYINVIIASNEKWVVPATGDERRFCVLQPSSKFQKDTIHFAKILKEQRTGGVEAMMYDLLEHDISAVDLRKAPMTAGLSEQVQASLDSVPAFWHSVINREYMLTDKDTGKPVKSKVSKKGLVTEYEFWPGMAFKYEVYAEYTQWCRVQNQKYPEGDVHFWRQTWELWAGGKQDKKTLIKDTSGKRMAAMVFPSLSEARDAFTFVTKIEFEYKEDADDGAEQQDIPFNNQF